MLSFILNGFILYMNTFKVIVIILNDILRL